MEDRIAISKGFKTITIILAATGIVVFIIGIRVNPEVTWGSYLLANYYFLSIAMGAAFFLVIQNITQSGWSAGFKRIPEAMMSYIPVSAVFFMLLYFGIHSIYHWSHEDAVAGDALLQHKEPYLNAGFFFIRMAVFFIAWIILTYILRKISLQEDSLDPGNQNTILALFSRGEMYSKIFIFVFAVTFTLAAYDWIMSVEAHWYSAIFAFKNVIAAFLHAVSIITLLVFILHGRGHFPFLNGYHLHDFSRYIFILSIVWGYMWFAQFIIIWYGNIPEETSYYFYRWQNGWKIMFYLQIALNWGVPFLVLLPVKTSRNKSVILGVIIILIIGQYVDLFVQIIPGITGVLRFGWIEAGLFLGFAGLFAFTVASALARANLIPSNHPYLDESVNHKFE